MTITIIIFFIAIILAFGMLSFRAWEIKTNRIIVEDDRPKFTGGLSFRYFEKIFLYVTKRIIQWIVLSFVKIWFTITTKIKIWIKNKLPKINKFFQKKEKIVGSRKVSFVERAVMESKIKIKRVKEKIKKEHEESLSDNIENKVDEIKEEVDKII